MKFQRSIKEEVNVNLTPLIDVVFLLLIFFMVSTTFSRNTNILINLPEATGETTEQQPIEIEILIAQNGTYSINGRQLVNAQIETLMRTVAEVSGGDTTIPLIITADANSTHQSVVTAMDAVAQLGFTSLNIATREPDTP
ncbi:MAG: biopolymer transporter ExbD [Gammaproteobacteria bacterium]|nr:biopolymer transporter ExbD [Gammaproteobacteria bacterium]